MKYIEEVPKETIAEHLRKLCSLGGIKPPSAGLEFIEFIQKGFARHSIDVIENAFANYLLGKYDIRQPQQLNVKFVSDILNRYISDNRHRLHIKPRVYQQLEAPKEEKPTRSAEEMAKENWQKVKDNNAVIFPSIYAKAWNELSDKPEVNQHQIDHYVELINDNQMRHFYKWKRERGHKVKNHQYPDHILTAAACYIYYLEL